MERDRRRRRVNPGLELVPFRAFGRFYMVQRRDVGLLERSCGHAQRSGYRTAEFRARFSLALGLYVNNRSAGLRALSAIYDFAEVRLQQWHAQQRGDGRLAHVDVPGGHWGEYVPDYGYSKPA